MTLVQYQPDPRLDLVFARTEKGSGVFSHCGTVLGPISRRVAGRFDRRRSLTLRLTLSLPIDPADLKK